MKIFAFLLSLCLLFTFSASAQDFEDLQATFPSYELGATITDAQIHEAFEKKVPKALVKAFLLPDNGALYAEELANDHYQWYPIGSVAINDKLSVFLFLDGEAKNASTTRFIKFATIFKGEHQDEDMTEATMGGFMENGVCLIYDTEIVVSENSLLLKEYSYQDAGLTEDFDTLKKQVKERGDYRELEYAFSSRGKIK